MNLFTFLFSKDPLIAAVKRLVNARSAAIEHNSTVKYLDAKLIRVKHDLVNAVNEHEAAKLDIKQAFDLQLD